MKKLLSGTTPVERRAGVIVVDLQEEIRHLLELSKGALEGVLGRELGESVRLEFAEAKREAPRAQPEAPAADSTPEADQSAIESSELLRSTMELFDAEIIEVKSAKQPQKRSGL